MKRYAITIFLSAFLGFQVQPLISKYILPWFGGSSSVWLISLLFFQIVLLVGYLYAFFISKIKTSQTQKIIHTIFLLLSLAFLPIIPNQALTNSFQTFPSLQILIILTFTIGLPYLLISATSPLLQFWFNKNQTNKSPYPLYAMSNIGSLIGLISFPFYFEPLMSRVDLSKSWSIFFTIFVFASLFIIFRLPKFKETNQKTKKSKAKNTPKRTKLVWFLLSCIGSMALLAITNELCLNISASPLIWVVPLSIYLTTFILSFGNAHIYNRKLFFSALIVISLVLAPGKYFISENFGLDIYILTFSLILFVVAFAVHSELYDLKPEPNQLTSYYLLIALGGAIGGFLVAIIAPLVFNNYWELFLISPAACLTIFFINRKSKSITLAKSKHKMLYYFAFSTFIFIFIIGLYKFYNESNTNTLISSRNFYGTSNVKIQRYYFNDEARLRKTLYNGNIIHGIQMIDKNEDMPVSYYSPISAIGKTIEILQKKENINIAIIGLGAGTISAYGRATDSIVYYEINPDIKTIAEKYFSYISKSPAKHDIIIGDARLSLTKENYKKFDLIVLDAFSSDAIPTHLLTNEAMEIYKKHLTDDGVIAFHISNRHLELAPAIINLADYAELPLLQIKTPDEKPFSFLANWILVTNNTAILDDPDLQVIHQKSMFDMEKIKPWTDDYINILAVIK